MIGGLTFGNILRLMPVVFFIAAFSYLLYNLAGDLVSGVLLQLVIGVAMCFISGCFYPVYFFPVSVQKTARFLPAAIAREHISLLITQQEGTGSGIVLLAMGLTCMLLALFLRFLRIKGGKEGER